jgi:FRG domain
VQKLTLNGQWIAPYSGTNSGTLTVEIDDIGDHFEGSVCAWDDSPQPNAQISFRTQSRNVVQRLLGLPIRYINNAGIYLAPDDIEKLKVNGTVLAQTVDIDIELRGSQLFVTWTTSFGTSGSAIAETPKTRAGMPSDLSPTKINTWAKFRAYVSKLERKRFAFRGQENSKWRLRSSFYRTGRASLERYVLQDVPELHKLISPINPILLNLNDRQHFAAFLNLAQHHGYPTPLLDWTWSPYVAAFHAFRKIKSPISRASKVRIYKFDVGEWNKLARMPFVFPFPPNITILDALSLGNPRAIPQQSLSTMSNVDDMESYIAATADRLRHSPILEVFDIPARERADIMNELDMMGINYGSMFPGLDGACESLRERNFPA